MALLPATGVKVHYILHLCLVVLCLSFVTPLKIYAPPRSPPKTTPKPAVHASGLELPYIHLLNGTSSDLIGDPYYNPSVPGTAESTLQFQNDTVYVVPGSVNTIAFQCEASYPVFWNLAHSKIHANAYNALRVLSVRRFDDPFDPSSFKYVTILTMNGPNTQLTGNYSCQCAARHEIQSSVYVFWEAMFGNVLVLSKENLTISLKSEKDDIHLPCHVADPDRVPKLVKLGQSLDKKVAPKDEQLALNDSILFSPATGFTLTNLPNPLGSYKCSLDQNDYLIVQVLHKNDTKPTSSPEPNYTFQYDEDNKQVQCCAKNGKKPPKIYMTICEHPSTCGLREFLTSDATTWYPYNQGRRRGSCSVLSIKTQHTGIIRCVGDGGFSIFKEFIVPVRVDRVPWNKKRNTTTYFRWEEIDPQEMIAVGPPPKLAVFQLDDGGGLAASHRKLQDDQAIYSKQLINLQCHMSRYYFASGNYWMVRWRNQTITQLEEDFSSPQPGQLQQSHLLYGYDRNQHANSISFVADSEMESVLCFGPVWNSSVWITKIHYLYVNESMSPRLEGGVVNETVHFTWYANETDKVLSCSAMGVPAAEFHWEKDNGTVLADSHNYHVFEPNVTVVPSTTTTTTEATTTTTSPTTAASSSDSGGGGDDDSDDSQMDDNYNNNKGKGRPSIKPKVSHSSLRINRVSYSTNGIFRCIATNFGGRVTKEFHITVLEAKSWTATVFFVISCLLTVVLMAGIIYLLRRLHKDRQEVNQLSSSVNFQNGGAIGNTGGIGAASGSSSSSASISTSTSRYQQHHNEEDSFHNSISFDNGKMTNNLIDAF